MDAKSFSGFCSQPDGFNESTVWRIGQSACLASRRTQMAILCAILTREAVQSGSPSGCLPSTRPPIGMLAHQSRRPCWLKPLQLLEANLAQFSSNISKEMLKSGFGTSSNDTWRLRIIPFPTTWMWVNQNNGMGASAMQSEGEVIQPFVLECDCISHIHIHWQQNALRATSAVHFDAQGVQEGTPQKWNWNGQKNGFTRALHIPQCVKA